MNIIIFGGTKGIGKEIATYLKPNHNICVASRTTPFIDDDVKFLSYNCDITNSTHIAYVIINSLIYWNRIDVIINSTGVVIFNPLLQYNLNDIEAIFNTNIKGAFFLSQEAIALFKRQRENFVKDFGRIIHIGSTRSFTVAPDKSAYTMSKFALRALNQSINLEFNNENIYSTLVCPGAVDIDGVNPKLVSSNDINQVIEKIISLPNNTNIEEVIIGGKL